MNKTNTFEAVEPGSGQYSLKTDLKLNAWLGVAVVVAGVSEYLLWKHAEWSPAVRATVALLPLAPGLLYVRSWTRFVRSLDELQRRIQQAAFLFASVGTVVIGTTVNVLIAQGVSLPGLRHGLELGGAFGVMFVLWLVGKGIAACRFN